ncbi:zinc-dependent alcohol dehydrogenase family protein [Chryseobacterium herbae]|uniref:Zinc-dependent alcohol dehydrogenase family protein n=1 Tax=Chryseobacterium herbae TaxID=2976476 RepID=A0ABT2IS85_9FLAO|nr:zinc-dependent alcohol dehydrogenase family protein [Chryseobacterium sp. pc1-10]MCT2561690.1 zinc-dependent alcohol dehydrogenase family protein [Chryseobacterium sp. pc1-10]
MNSDLNTKTMKALITEEFGKPFVMKDIDQPIPKDHQVLIRIKAAGLNPLDLKIKNGQAAHAQVNLPAVLGIDMSGIVIETGKNVHDFKMGDEVFGMVGGIGDHQGTLAEYITADAEHISLKPKSISFQEAAAIPLIFITAWEALADQINIQSGQTVLIHGGAGGVGHMAVQIAVAKGAKVYTTVQPNSSDQIRKYGAEPIDYTTLSVDQYVQQYTNGLGFDAVVDTVGGSVLDDSFRAVKQYTGHVVSILGWGTHSLAPLSFRNAKYSGVFTLYPLLSGERKKHHGDILKEAALLMETGKVKVQLHSQSYSLEQADDAYSLLESGKATGKIVICCEK